MVRDRGTWIAETDDMEAALKKGDLKFTLQGEKLPVLGSWCGPEDFAARPKNPGCSSKIGTVSHRPRTSRLKNRVQ
jgi:hypothetical protein